MMITLIVLLSALVPTAVVATGIWLYLRSRKKKVTGTATTPAPATPASSTPTSTSATLPRDWKTWVKLALLAGLLIFWIWFFPDTVPGKALLEATGFSTQNKWYPWVMQYIPTVIILWVGWRVLATPVVTKTEKSSSLVPLIVATLMIGGFAVLITERWNKDSDPLPKQAVFKFDRAVPGMSETRMMGLNTTAIIVMPTAKLGQKPHSFCAAITHPSEGEAARTAKFEVAPGGKGNVGHLRLTQASKEKLLRSGVTVYDATVTVKAMKEDGSHPCP